jgi:hypothetical protein
MIGIAPQCIDCKYFHKSNKNGMTCDAFVKGIPVLIVTSVVAHDEPYPGDNGIQFEPIEAAKSADLANED